MLKKITSLLLVVTTLLGSLTAYAYARETVIDIEMENISNHIFELSTEIENLPHISLENISSLPMVENNTLTISNIEEKEYKEIRETPQKDIKYDTEVIIPAPVYNSDGYVNLNESEEGDFTEHKTPIHRKMIVSENDSISTRTTPYSMDMVYRLGNMNAKDSFALQNQTGRTNFIGDNLGEEYIDPLTGNLIVTETDLVLPGVDGLDLNLSRYYSLAEAELYTKTADIEKNNKIYKFPAGGGFQVTETKTNTDTQNTEIYNYFYLDETQADKRVREIETRDTQGGLFEYTAIKMQKSEGDTVQIGYHYTSKILSVSYQQARNNLGAGWSWSFPSVQVLKDNPQDMDEIAKAIYYHDGKGKTMEVEYDGDGYSFANYVGKDITFGDCFDYTPNIPDLNNTIRIDYVVDNPDGTKYYFGMYGELRAIMDRYDNRILFDYIKKDFYGVNNSLVLSTITDTVNRKIKFEYSNEYKYEADEEKYESVTVTVYEPNSEEAGLTLVYEKLMADIYDANRVKISTEPILMNVTNAIGEKTRYFPTYEEGSRYLYFPIQFTFTDKSFNSNFVYNTSGYVYNMVYLLGNIVRPHSNTYYFYDKKQRNLGHSGVCEGYVVAKKGEYEPVVIDTSESELLLTEYYEKDVSEYLYYGDYTEYSICSLEGNEDLDYGSCIVKTKETTANGTHTRKFYKIQDVVLEKKGSIEYESPVGNKLSIDYENISFSKKQPVTTKYDYSNNNGYKYSSHVQKTLSGKLNKSYGKPTLITQEVDEEIINSADEAKYSVCYAYFDDTGFIKNKSWYRDEKTPCKESYEYANQRLSRIIKADGSSESYTYEYNSDGKVTKRSITTINDEETIVIEENYNSSTGYAYPSTVVKRVTGNGTTKTETTEYTYDMLLGLVESMTDNDGNITRFEYDKLGRPTRIIYPKYSTYTSYNNKDVELLPVERTTYTSVRKDDYGNLLQDDEDILCQKITNEITYYVVLDTTPEYPTDGELSDLSYTFKDSKVSFYMGTGELIESNVMDEVDGETTYVTTSYFYNSEARTVTETDPKGNVKTTYYDGLGREAKVIDIFGNQHITEYNLDGDGVGFKTQSYFVPVTNAAAKENVVEYTYDRVGQLTKERLYENYQNNIFIEKKYTYDIAGNLIGVIDANENLNKYGFTYKITYDKLNRATTITNAQNDLITNTYDNAGNIKTQKITDTNGNESTLYQRAYDGEGKLITDTDNAGNSNTYTYDDMGRLWQSVDKDGKLYNLYYNAYDTIERESYIKVNKTLTDRQYLFANPYGANVIYDVRGQYNETTQSYPSYLNEIVYNTYSNTGKLISRIDDFQNDITDGGEIYFKPYQGYTYDGLGNITSASFSCVYDENEKPIGISTHYEYTKNRLSKVNVRDVYIDYDFYDDGKLKSVTFPTLANGTVLKSEYTYDGLSRLSTLTNTRGTDVLSSYNYTYDSNGNILSVNENVEGMSNNVLYTYDELNRINSVSGSKNEDSYYEYDYRGNRKVNFEQLDFLSEENTEFRYNEQNQMYYAEVGDDSVYIEYDASGYRYVKESSSSGIEFYIYDQSGRLQTIANLVVSNIDGINRVIMYPVIQYIWGPDRVLAQIDIVNDTYYYYLYNGHGDVVQIVDTNGNIKNRYDYDVWGNFLKKEETIKNHFTYFGQTYDEETGLYYLRARYYDPTTGRFTQQDPAEDGYNWYVYGNQNPVIYADPSGEFWETIFDVASFGVSLKDVIENPKDGWNWAALAGDAVDFVPFVAGIGESVKGVRASAKFADDVVDAKNLVKTSKITKFELPAENSKKFTKLKGGQGYRDSKGYIWKKDMLHKDHWDVTDKKGNKIREVDFNGNQIWPNGPKNKNK